MMKRRLFLGCAMVLAFAACSNAAAPPSSSSPGGSLPSSEDRVFSRMEVTQRANVGTTEPPYFIKADKKYVATIKTSKGDIKVELDQAAAPRTVNNFVYLAKYGFYDGMVFHRVEPNFVIQGGDPLGTGSGGPGYNLPAEIKLPHVDGAIAMARLPDAANPERKSSGSQFYITLGTQASLDGAYTVFGKTISGQDVARKILNGDKIERVDISE